MADTNDPPLKTSDLIEMTAGLLPAEKSSGNGVHTDFDRELLSALLRFKAGTGGEAVEYLGEWDRALRPLLHRVFTLALARR